MSNGGFSSDDLPLVCESASDVSLSSQSSDELCNSSDGELSPPASKIMKADSPPICNPLSQDHHEWASIPLRTPVPSTQFSGSSLIAPELQCATEPLEFFRFYIPQSFLLRIAEWTNEYAQSKGVKLRPLSTTDTVELDAFLGVHVDMGIQPPSRIKDMWSTTGIYDQRPVSKVISRNRFFEINSNLHCESVRDEKAHAKLPRESRDKLYKVRLLLDLFSSKCLKGFTPPRDIAID